MQNRTGKDSITDAFTWKTGRVRTAPSHCHRASHMQNRTGKDSINDALHMENRTGKNSTTDALHMEKPDG